MKDYSILQSTVSLPPASYVSFCMNVCVHTVSTHIEHTYCSYMLSKLVFCQSDENWVHVWFL